MLADRTVSCQVLYQTSEPTLKKVNVLLVIIPMSLDICLESATVTHWCVNSVANPLYFVS